jgi:streptogramin lyase
MHNVVDVLLTAAHNSPARSEYWDRIHVEKNRFLKPWLFASAFCAMAALGYGVSTRLPSLASLKPAATAAMTFATPYLEPTNISFDGQNIWACDWMGQSIYKHRPDDFTLTRIYHFPGRHFTALAWTDGILWSTDAWEKKIYRHAPDANLSVVSSYPSPGTSPSGIAGNDQVLWTCDSAARRIYRHRLDGKLSVEAAYASPGPSPSGLFFDGVSLWSVDSKTNLVYRHRLDDRLSVAAVFAAPGGDQKGYNAGGIARAGKNIWVCSEKAGMCSVVRRSSCGI